MFNAKTNSEWIKMGGKKPWREKGETRSNYLNDVKFVL